MQTRKLTPAGRFVEALDVLRDAVLEGLPADASDGQRAALARVVDDLPDRLQEVLTRIDEPREDVVVISKWFAPNGLVYRYAALRAEGGFWYLSGSTQERRRYTWHQLVDWAFEGKRVGGDASFTVPIGWRALEVHR